MSRTEIIGSWHNSGYHGHFRSKSRSDFICEYRFLAKPAPPKNFIRRSQENSGKHVFSRHDNRHSFMNDALYFEQGMGRKRIRTSTKPDRELLAWMPQKKEFDRRGPVFSTYKVDYRGRPAESLRQQVTERTATSFDNARPNTTTYRYSHGLDNPNRETLNAMCNTGLTTTRNRKAKGYFGSSGGNVAGCLNWFVPTPPQKPAATQTVPPQQMTSTAPATSPVPVATVATPPVTIATPPVTETKTVQKASD